MPNHIDHPVHYTQGIECIDYILSHNMDYLEGNIIKYITRYKFKHGVDDLRKAEWYLKRLMAKESLGVSAAPPVMPVGPDWPKPGEPKTYGPIKWPKFDKSIKDFVIPVGPSDWPMPPAVTAETENIRFDDNDSYWPSPSESAKPLYLEDIPNKHPKEKFCCPQIDLGAEHKDEVLKETLQAMKDDECRHQCANYIRPYKF